MRADLPTGGVWHGAGDADDFTVGPRYLILPTREQIRERALNDIRSMVERLQPGETLTVECRPDDDYYGTIYTVRSVRPT